MVTQRGALFDEWSVSMRKRGLLPATVRKRVRLTRDWLGYIADPWEATGPEFEAWLDGHDGWLVSRTRYAAISHLHSFYRWAIRTGKTTTDPTVMVERPTVAPNLPRPIHPADLAIAVAVADAPMRAVLWLMATSGLRCCEIARLRWDDVHAGTARVLGKGSKERLVPVHPAAIVALEAVDRSSVFVFDGWQARGDYQAGAKVSRRVADHMHALGISSTAHQLRHYCGTEALRNSGNLRKVQKLLGHASPATTAIYTALDIDDLIDVVGRIEIPAA